MTTLYPNQSTTRQIVQAVAEGNRILWVNGPRTLYYNTAITSGSTAGVFATPTDGGAAFDPQFIVMQGTNGFASAARAAGLYAGSGLSSEFEDDAAAQNVWGGITVQSNPVLIS